jgi:hypothetical protein
LNAEAHVALRDHPVEDASDPEEDHMADLDPEEDLENAEVMVHDENQAQAVIADHEESLAKVHEVIVVLDENQAQAVMAGLDENQVQDTVGPDGNIQDHEKDAVTETVQVMADAKEATQEKVAAIAQKAHALRVKADMHAALIDHNAKDIHEKAAHETVAHHEKQSDDSIKPNFFSPIQQSLHYVEFEEINQTSQHS